MQRIMVGNRKGGVGKTTTAVHLAHGAALSGLRVLLVDTDGQGNCSAMLGVRPERGLAELLLAEASPAEAVTPAREGLDLIAGSARLAIAQRDIGRRDYDTQYALAEALRPLEAGYDVIVIDTAPAYSELWINATFYAGELLAPINMEVLAARGFVDMLEELRPIAERSGIKLEWIVPTMADGRKRLTRDIVEQLEGAYGSTVEAPIPYAALFSELPHAGRTVYEQADGSRAALAYAKLTGRVIR